MVAENVWICESTWFSSMRSLRENSVRSLSIAASSAAAESSVSSSERRSAFFSAMSSVRTSFHEVASAGSISSFAAERSRTLIWLSTCCLTIGMTVL